MLAMTLTTVFMLNGAVLAVPDVLRPVAQPTQPGQVTIVAGPFREAMLRDRAYLLILDADRLLHAWRLNAGLPSSAKPYGGWEEPNGELRGHSLGHYLTACALLSRELDDQPLRDRCATIVAGLAECNRALGTKATHPGYLSAFPESFIDRVEAGKPVWAPYYTLHKVFAGLIDVYQQTGNETALRLVSGMGDWCWSRFAKLDDAARQRTLGNEHGGMMESLANLYALTGKAEHLSAARAFDHKAVFDPLAAGEDRLNGLHANTQIPKLTGSIRLAELTGEPRWRKAAETFWTSVALRRSYVTGGHSDGEHFHPVEQMSRQLSPATTETCNTYNMLKLTGHLFALDPQARYMDFYERALLNHILGSFDPRTGMFTYFVPLGVGRFKTFSTPEDSFWCCVGTGMENPARFAEAIYSTGPADIWVNQFIASELRMPEAGLTLRQETNYPESDTTTLRLSLDRDLRGTLHLRWPAWATHGAKVTINREPVTVNGQPGSYITLEREWHQGDQLTATFPFGLRTEAMPDDPRTLAVLDGPLVLAADLGRAAMDPPIPYAKGQLDYAGQPIPPMPRLVGDRAKLVESLEPVAEAPHTYRTKGFGQPDEVTFRPFYGIADRRYGVYFTVLTAREYEEEQARRARLAAAEAALAERTIDRVAIGDGNSEKAHNQLGERTDAGRHLDRAWRHATDGGWFSYDLAVKEGLPSDLLVTYWGDDAGARTFDILVNGERLATQTLDRLKPGEFTDVAYRLPADMLMGKSKITVRFQGKPGNFAGGVFGLRVVRRMGG
ncbi:MAG: glycoside hydrolase family 127 protein [Armatimonadetes bacterium]|nr:glycoside hydrolase family 127 protein [Armatimonadota bacterium]